MKFLVLALCVCAASAASFGQGASGYKPYNKGFQNPVVAPAVVAAKAVASAAAPAAAPFAAAAAATYDAGAAIYQGAKQVANNAYSSEGNAQILSSESENTPDSYAYSFKTDNGIKTSSSGAYKNIGEAGAIVSQGSYEYPGPDGPVVVNYIADENGYQPSSNILPVGPATPPEIVAALEYIALKSRDTVAQKY